MPRKSVSIQILLANEGSPMIREYTLVRERRCADAIVELEVAKRVEDKPSTDAEEAHLKYDDEVIRVPFSVLVLTR